MIINKIKKPIVINERFIISVKIKGSPKNLKTTVNPIKTLTPRFIVRAVEKLKRKDKEQVK